MFLALLLVAVVAGSLAATAPGVQSDRPPRPSPPTADPAATPAAGRAAARPRHERPRYPDRPSVAVGAPSAGRLVRGVRLPATGAHHRTWDPIRKGSPSRGWRRHGTDRLVRRILRIARAHRRAHPGAPPMLVGDLSRPRGGDFGARVSGGLGHASHQNGLDVDVYYPRRDRRPRPPTSVTQVDLRLAQDLVDRFVAAGAQHVFTGPGLALRGPPGVVQPLRLHDNHLHARIRPGPSRGARP